MIEHVARTRQARNARSDRSLPRTLVSRDHFKPVLLGLVDHELVAFIVGRWPLVSILANRRSPRYRGEDQAGA
jgi:hypothetical protein